MAEPGDTMLAAFLLNRDQPCPQCAYNLRDLQGNRCPECGEELVLRVNMAEPHQQLLLAGLIGLSADAGFNGLLIIYVLLRMDDHLPRYFWEVIVVGFCAFSVLIFAWLRCWRWLRRRDLCFRIVLVIVCWILALIDIFIFSYTIR